MINYFVTLKRLKKYVIYILGITLVSLFLSTFFNNVEAVTYKENLQILDESKTVESRAFISYLNESYQVSTVEENSNTTNTLILNKDFSENIKKQIPLTLIYHGIIASGQDYSTVEKKLQEGRNNVIVTSTNKDISMKNFLYFNVYLLVQLTIPITVMLFNNSKRSNVIVRQKLANNNPRQTRLFEFLGIITFLIIPIITINVGSAIMNPQYLEVLPLAAGTQILTVFGALVLGYLASAIAKANNMSFILAIVIPLVVGFSSGSWMPFDYQIVQKADSLQILKSHHCYQNRLALILHYE